MAVAVLPATSSKSKMYWGVCAITRAPFVVLHVVVADNDDARLERGHLVLYASVLSWAFQ